MLYSEMGVHLSVSTVKRTRKKRGWKRCGPKYCQMVRETNRIARLAFAGECLETGETFDDVIFTDESTIWLSLRSSLFRFLLARESESQGKVARTHGARAKRGMGGGGGEERKSLPFLPCPSPLCHYFFFFHLCPRALARLPLA